MTLDEVAIRLLVRSVVSSMSLSCIHLSPEQEDALARQMIERHKDPKYIPSLKRFPRMTAPRIRCRFGARPWAQPSSRTIPEYMWDAMTAAYIERHRPALEALARM